MRCETSFFSLTLYKKHLTRNWPLWAAHLGLWLLILPVQLWNQHIHGDLNSFVRNHPMDSLSVLFPWLAFVAALVAVVVFFHLFKSNAANFIGALPLRREGVFLTAFAAGYTMLVGPLLVVTLVTILLESILGILAPEILVFWAAGALNSFFWLSFAALCCVISGHAVAAVAFYFIFNWIVPVMVALVEGLLSGFLYGFVGFGAGFYEGAAWLCPVLQLVRHNWRGGMGFDDWNMLAIYAAVGFLMTLCAVGLHHIRKAERSGDLIVFDPIKWLFKICVTVCGGMGFGTFLTIIVFDSMQLNEGWKFGICCAVAAFICYMVSEMLLAKSFKVWKHWKGAVISAVAFILVVAAVDMDWIGFTTRVPDPASVKTVTASFSGTGISGSAGNGLKFTGEDVKAVTDLHRYLVEHREDIGYGDEYYLSLNLEYKLGWTTLRRQYRSWYAPGDEEHRLLNAALGKGDSSFPYDRGTPNHLSFSLCVSGENGDDAEYIGWEINTEDNKAVWDAVAADMLAGRYVLRSTPGEEELNTGELEAQWINNYAIVGGGQERQFYTLRLSPELTETWKTLKERGYLDRRVVSASWGVETVG